MAILAPLIFEPWLDSFYVQYYGNEASRYALLKGIDKQPPQILTNRATKIIGDISFAASFFSEMPEIARLHKRLLKIYF